MALYKLLVLPFFLSISLCAFDYTGEPKTFSQTVIAQIPLNKAGRWIIYADGGFIYHGAHYPQGVITVSCKRSAVYINDKKIDEKLCCMIPRFDSFYCNGQRYHGCLVIEKKRTTLIMHAVELGSLYHAMQERLSAGLKAALQVGKKKISRKENQLYHVRVLLAEHKCADGACLWKVSSPAGFGVVDLQDGEQKRFYNMRDMTIAARHGQFFINDVRYPSKKFLLVPREGHLSFNGHDYHGNFILTLDKDLVYLINSIDIEDYVFSVLRTETWPGWPLEINKVCAIASRTYVVGVIANSRNSGLPYHVKNTSAHQTYGGIHPDQTLRKAVEDTHGIFLAYDNKPIVAMFDAVCGGVIPADVKGVNFVHAPYLKRTQACNFCKNATGYRWSVTLSEKKALKIVQEIFHHLKNLKEMKIVSKDKGGVVHDVLVRGKGLINGTAHLKGKQFYFLFKPHRVRSFNFSIKADNKKYIISGKGIGHHMGLCQWGARAMVDKGYDYKKILQFYYPGTSLLRFY